MHLYFLFDKADIFETFKEFKIEIERLLEKVIKIVRSDKDGK